MKKLFTADRETGTFIQEVATVEEGRQLIEEYETADRNDGTYEADFYSIVDKEHFTIE